MEFSDLVEIFSGHPDAAYKNASEEEKQSFLESLGYIDFNKYLSNLNQKVKGPISREVYPLSYMLSDFSRFDPGRDLMISDHSDKSKIVLTRNRSYDEESENNPWVVIEAKDNSVQNGNWVYFSFNLNELEAYTEKNKEDFERCNVFDLPIYQFAKELYEYYKKQGKFDKKQNDGNFKRKSKRKSKGKSKRKSKGKSKGKSKRQQRKSKRNQA